ncbi:MAG: hypothetical protein ACRD0P_34575, partial [Stackebrandtia sp.]
MPLLGDLHPDQLARRPGHQPGDGRESAARRLASLRPRETSWVMETRARQSWSATWRVVRATSVSLITAEDAVRRHRPEVTLFPTRDSGSLMRVVSV